MPKVNKGWTYYQTIHPMQKPTELIEMALKNHSLLNVIDVFAGSGSVLIACENVFKRCFAMEIEPKFCSLIIERWENKTGKKAFMENGQTIPQNN